MADLKRLSLKKLEARCDQEALAFYREYYRDSLEKYRTALQYYAELDGWFREFYPDDPAQARSAVQEYVNQLKRIRDQLAAIHTRADPHDAWDDVLALCRRDVPEAPWQRLPRPDIKRDIETAREWLVRQLQETPRATGLYLGLDTLNMRRGRGMNVAIGRSTECNPWKDDRNWLTDSMSFGDDYLIRELYAMHREYSKKAWRKNDAFSYADYALFLCYSGIVLGHAFHGVRVKQTLQAVWGFHDGDLFVLGRRTKTRFTFVCR